jgi:hypothetical protein
VEIGKAVPAPPDRALFRLGPSVLAAFVTTLTCAAVARAQVPALPFGIGEKLSYSIRSTGIGSGGKAVMAISGPADVRGTPAMVATFSISAHLALFLKGSVKSKSWIDPQSFASLRFTKVEHRPLSSANDSIEIFPAELRWVGMRSDSGVLASDTPLDELSFIYFLRTLPLVPDTLYSFDRFYDQRRSPTTVQVAQRETVTTPAGTFETVELDMHVKDPALDHGEGVVRVWVSDDRWRLPVRIESAMPGLGTGVFTLTTVVHGATATPDSTRYPTPSGRTE